MSYGSVNLVISQGLPKFETQEIDPPKKKKWQTKKRFKTQKRKEKQLRKSANKTNPGRLKVKGKKKSKHLNAEEKIKCRIQKAKIKEGLLIEKLKRYEVPKLQGPMVKQDDLTGEERFYMKKMAQKGSNYLQVGRRGVYGGVVLNMHLHWKKHETVKVFCKPCKPGQVHEYANEIARLSGGIPIQIIGDDTIVFYRGKNYVQPEVMSPIDTLSRKKALEKGKYEQSLDTVRRFIAISEKELELYYRHCALYGDPNDRNPISILDGPKRAMKSAKKFATGNQTLDPSSVSSSSGMSSPHIDSSDQELSTSGEDFDDEDLYMSQHHSETNGDSDPSDE